LNPAVDVDSGQADALLYFDLAVAWLSDRKAVDVDPKPRSLCHNSDAELEHTHHAFQELPHPDSVIGLVAAVGHEPRVTGPPACAAAAKKDFESVATSSDDLGSPQ